MNLKLGPNSATARIAGVLFLGLVIAGVFAEFYVRQDLIVSGDAMVTFNNIVNNESLFRIGIVSDLTMNALYFLFGFVMYHLLESVNKKQAQFMLMCVMMSVAFYSVNMLNQVAVLFITSKSEFMSGFNDTQLSELIALFLNIHGNGYNISQIFFGLYLLPLGLLFYHSGFLPKWIGVLLMIGCVVDLIDVVLTFLEPNMNPMLLENITIPADLGEFSMFLWLLIMGVKSKKEKTKS